jgi:hypothetical protein
MARSWAAYEESFTVSGKTPIPKSIAERVAIIRQEIRDLRELNARYRTRTGHGQLEKSAYRNRQLRLFQIKEELVTVTKQGD